LPADDMIDKDNAAASFKLIFNPHAAIAVSQFTSMPVSLILTWLRGSAGDKTPPAQVESRVRIHRWMPAISDFSRAGMTLFRTSRPS
jgi:hypothetical protein